MKKINYRVTGIIFVLGMLYSLSENGKKQATYDLKAIRHEYKHYLSMEFRGFSFAGNRSGFFRSDRRVSKNWPEKMLSNLIFQGVQPFGKCQKPEFTSSRGLQS